MPNEDLIAIPYVLQAGEGVSPSDTATKCSGETSGGMLNIIESKTTGGAPWHIHTREDEFMYVASGVIQVRIAAKTTEVGPGGFISLPRNIPHMWDVVSDEATVLMMTIPAMLDKFLAEFHAAPDWPSKNDVAAKWGIKFLPPSYDPAGG